MARFVLTAKVGSNGISATWRDTQTGYVGSFTIEGPKESAQEILKILEGSPKSRPSKAKRSREKGVSSRLWLSLNGSFLSEPSQ